MKIYIDFDGTVFNTDKFIDDFTNILNNYDVDKNLFDELNGIICDNNILFNIDVVINYFIEKYNISKSVKNEIINLLNESYVYSDVVDCLNLLINDGYELYLLTYGDDDYQRLKINASNLSRFFKGIIITQKDKSKLDIDYENSIFIDNNPFEVEKFYNSNAKSVIRIRRSNEKFSDTECNISNIPECRDFYDIVKLLKGGV